MPTSTVVVGSAVGLHARPAAIIASAVNDLGEEVTLAMPGGDPVDASSALLIMTLGAAKGDSVEVSSPSEPAHAAIAALVAQDLDV
ncbi:HPr family phosphocarrier protein [Actinoplanes regularis]|uniref:HPr family phosphocarrier protein n=1 Tax=Actinoplanes regularis TaxID=52697 RepID=UPI0024A133C4|nr:HPr family phosphocarrier protein [Actinoplanes regularis]GLW35511.1 phosphocarrier protein HPr [Actinoplanes regularis]